MSETFVKCPNCDAVVAPDLRTDVATATPPGTADEQRPQGESVVALTSVFMRMLDGFDAEERAFADSMMRRREQLNELVRAAVAALSQQEDSKAGSTATLGVQR